MSGLSKNGRAFTPRDRRLLLAAIGRGRVVHLHGRDWRYTGAPQGQIAMGTGSPGKVPVARRNLDQLVDEGLVVLGPADVWQLTYTGELHAAGGEAA